MNHFWKRYKNNPVKRGVLSLTNGAGIRYAI